VRIVTIALDAMGGDRAPSEICLGALDAVVPGQLEIVLVGDTPLILAEYGGALPRGVTIRHAPEQIAFDEEPLAAVRA
jgi:glycerol-3-phosphate acyltransferase PlsX